MKPCSQKVLHSSNFLVGNYNADFGSANTVCRISGDVDKLGVDYSNAMVMIARKIDFLPFAIRKPDAAGCYCLKGLNADLVCFIAGFDLGKQYNAVIQDNVVPK